eukprot:5997360-Prorocentrum_lima.AAC.1
MLVGVWPQDLPLGYLVILGRNCDLGEGLGGWIREVILGVILGKMEEILGEILGEISEEILGG